MSLTIDAVPQSNERTLRNLPNEKDLARAFRSAPHRRIDIGHSRVPYWRFGEGPDVVFVHGWPLDAATFRRIVPKLAGSFTCHLFDLPGVGQTESDAAAPLDLVSHGTSVRRLVDALGLNRYAFLAHDSGGFVARIAAAGDPRVRGLVLGNTEIPGHTPALVAAMALLVRAPFGSALMRTLLRSRTYRHSALGLGGCFGDASHLDGDFHDLFVEPLISSKRVAAQQLQILKTLHAGMMKELSASHRRIDAPVALVWGTDDPFFPLPLARKMVPQFAGGASLHELLGAKVFPHEDRPEEFAQLADRFLREWLADTAHARAS
jgi:pimeloyl-ACP methyl ester carboxylesterase